MLPPIQHPPVTFGTFLAEVAVSEMLCGVGFEGSPWNASTTESSANESSNCEPAPRPSSRALQIRARLVRT
jgi:hypothetical protein